MAEKRERTSAKSAFTRAENSLNNALKDKSIVRATVLKRYDSLKTAWENVQLKHNLYVQILESDDVIAEEDWIEELQSSFDDCESRVDAYFEYEEINSILKEKEESENQKRLRDSENLKDLELEYKTKVAIQKTRDMRFYKACSNLEGLIDNYEGQHAHEIENIIKDGLQNLKLDLNSCQEVQESIATYQVRGIKDVEARYNYEEIIDRFNAVELNARKFIHKIRSENFSKESNKIMKFEKIKMEKFDGNIRKYSRFREEFKKFIKPSYNDDQEAFVLKSYLTLEVLEEVESLGENAEEIWSRLDEKYGDQSKLVDLILADLKRFRKLAEKPADILRLINTVEKAFIDLKYLGKESEMSNSTIISIIEERLPSSIEEEWVKIVTGAERERVSDDKFAALLEFLKNVKRRIEYKESDIRKREFSKVSSNVHFAEATNNFQTPYARYRCLIHENATHETKNCRAFLEMDTESRFKTVMDNRACFSCLKRNHRSSDCRHREQCTIEGCFRYHNALLHSDKIETNNLHTNNRTKGGKQCLLQIMSVKVATERQGNVNVLWDTGATISLITFKKAKQLGLEGKGVKLRITKVGGCSEDISSYMYELPLLDIKNEIIKIYVYGIDEISSQITEFPQQKLKELVVGIEDASVTRPNGEVDVLIGYEYAGYHPRCKYSNGHLLVLENRFGTCIGGSHPSIMDMTKAFIQHATINLVEKIKIDDFFSIEGMGVQCLPKCGSCRCGKCPYGGKDYTLKEERELKIIEEGLKYDSGEWIARYPWIKDPNLIEDNYSVARKVLEKLEKRLMKTPEHAILYDNQIKDMEERRVARKLTNDEIQKYDGPVHYINHHEVMKPGASTPCRIVFNSSARYKGQSLNDFWAKGPLLINALIGVLIRFREGIIAMTADIKKMYHAVKIQGIDQHTHRFLWRNMQLESQPNIYCMTSVSFGDKPAGNIAIMALKLTAKMFARKYPDESKTLLENTYVDDILESVDSREGAIRFAQNIETILHKGGFSVKEWKFSGKPFPKKDENNVKIFDLLINESKSESVLGMQWRCIEDEFFYNVRINFSPKSKNVRVGPDLTLDQLITGDTFQLTKRIILSQVNSIYDPLGIASPFIVKAKIMMKRLWMGEAKGLEWDDVLPKPICDSWMNLFREIFEMRKVSFPRSIKPVDAIGEPTLIIFSDGSDDAYGSCSYVRWELKNSSFQSHLIMAKTRVTPTRKISPVRSEIMGALMAKRLYDTIQKECRYKFRKIYFIIDSEIVRSMLLKESYGFNSFVSIRIGEIQSSTQPSDWYWIKGELNVADCITRGKSPRYLTTDEWRHGPAFLGDNESTWPLEQRIYSKDLPEMIKPVLNVVNVREVDDLAHRIDINRYSSYNKLIRVTARILSLYEKHPQVSLFNAVNEPTASQLAAAESFWVEVSQTDIINQMKPSYLKRLGAVWKKNKLCLGNRTSNFTYDVKDIFILPYDHRISELFARKIHNEAHLGVASTVSKIRNRFWILKVTRLVKKITRDCITCRKLRKQQQQQKMGPLPVERMLPSPAWNTTGIDYFGPFEIKGEVNKRATGKGYGILFNCFMCRSVHIELASDYSTQGFLLALRRFVSIRGYPSVIISDPGSQLIAASIELKKAIENLKLDELISFGAMEGMEWRFTPADGPWQNGTTESLVKSVKRALRTTIGEQRMSFSELQTVFYEVANLVNERPIGKCPSEYDNDNYLSPNHLLLGRASNRVPSGPFNEPTTLKKRFEFVEKIVDGFWKRWIMYYFPSLIIEQKWHVEHRNVSIGDIVLVQDSNVIRGKWKMAIVDETIKSNDGNVRKVILKYKNVVDEDTRVKNAYTRIERPIQRLIVLLPVEEQ